MSKKSFFYNPQFRMGVYLFGQPCLWIFQGLSLLIPKLDHVISEYDTGGNLAPLSIGAVGAFVLEAILLQIGSFKPTFNSNDVGLVLGLYVTGTLVGWLSLIKMRDYENEED
jgi:uncharacterized membrane protein YeaQ/YmgE (transglycosylase-associated protein family)